MIYNFYIFDRKGSCLYYREWNRPYNSFPEHDQGEERKLVYGMIFSIKELVGKMKNSSADDGLHFFKTDTFTLHHLETASGLRFVLNTDRATPDLRSNLLDIYGKIFVEYVTKNPTYDPTSGAEIDSPYFDKALAEYIEGLSCFR
mmetsp:Transcript_48683/g.110499  ORF Transcript_48683/g.110499 Transcript_48683/m.110499 type:complete len:145 (+) Transcript_48683:157-591(+)